MTLLQGDLDPLAPAEARQSLEAEFSAEGTTYDMVVYDGVAHAFTLPFVGSDPSTGFAYDEAAAMDAKDRISEILLSLKQ